jgi:putative SOS response-associated peptidase YedK
MVGRQKPLRGTVQLVQRIQKVFALDETRPFACFAGIWTNWTSARTVKEGETFLTTEPNSEVGAIHPKAL